MKKLILTVYGLVQGVGFRPYVKELGESLKLSGSVKNYGGIVKIKICGLDSAMDEMVHRLSLLVKNNSILPGSFVERIEREEGDFEIENGSFSIEESSDFDDEIRLLPPDIALCEDCKKELFDKNNRRYRNPFISCVSCGPRFTIMESVPYDRKNTSMKDFMMCDECRDEYFGKKILFNNEKNRRHFAQTISCNSCGPVLYTIELKDNSLKKNTGNEESLKRTVEVLKNGGIAAIKGIGGFHLAFDAFNEGAEKRLREKKKRENKPFAVMFNDVSDIKKYAYVSKKEEELLRSKEAPIVLLDRKEDNKKLFIGGSNCTLGAILPSNPVQYLILNDLREEKEEAALVMTSGNLGGEPIIRSDDKMIELLREGAADIILSNDREILYALDDSIYQVTNASGEDIVQVIRRARGIVPKPVWLNGFSLENDLFTAGGDLKSVFSLGRKNAVFLSGHFNDLVSDECKKERERNIEHLKRLLNIEPKIIVSDKHPGYVSTLTSEEMAKEKEKPCFKVQHHISHVLSVAAEHNIKGSFIGCAFDGTGYGDDGTIWGSECFFVDLNKKIYKRADHFKSVLLPAGDISAKDCRITSFCYKYDLYKDGLIDDEELLSYGKFLGFDEKTYSILKGALDNKLNVLKNSSLGRGFDAVSANLSLCFYNTYEGEAAIKLQNAASDENDPAFLYAFQYHKTVSDGIIDMIKGVREREDKNVKTVLLSGGCMVNKVLLKLLIPNLKKSGFDVYLNEKVPPGDGGIALGQVFYDIRAEID